jgi:hypothetical protein
MMCSCPSAMVLQASCPMAHFILHKHTHELILGCQQLLDADRCTRWRRGQWISTWVLTTTLPMANGSLGLGMSGITFSVALVCTISHN